MDLTKQMLILALQSLNAKLSENEIGVIATVWKKDYMNSNRRMAL